MNVMFKVYLSTQHENFDIKYSEQKKQIATKNIDMHAYSKFLSDKNINK